MRRVQRHKAAGSIGVRFRGIRVGQLACWEKRGQQTCLEQGAMLLGLVILVVIAVRGAESAKNLPEASRGVDVVEERSHCLRRIEEDLESPPGEAQRRIVHGTVD